MAGQATGCNGHDGHEHRHWNRRPSLVPHTTGDDG